MPAHLRSATTATFFLALFIGGTSAATAADDLKGIVCPPNIPYCIQKPALTQEEIDVLGRGQLPRSGFDRSLSAVALRDGRLLRLPADRSALTTSTISSATGSSRRVAPGAGL